MKNVRHESLGPDGEFAAAVSRTALRVEIATQEQRPATGDLTAGRRLRVYVLGRWSMLAQQVRVGDRLDDEWRVESVSANAAGQLEALAIQA